MMLGGCHQGPASTGLRKIMGMLAWPVPGPPHCRSIRDVLQQSRAVHRLQKDLLSVQHSELKGCMESRYFGQGVKY